MARVQLAFKGNGRSQNTPITN